MCIRDRVEAADDICYQMMDIEDAHKLKILTTRETQDLLLSYFPEERKLHMLKTLEIVSDVNEQIGYLRSCVIGLLIRECTQAFLNNEIEILEGNFKGSLIKHISSLPASAYNHCADISLDKIYRSRDVLAVSYTHLDDLAPRLIVLPFSTSQMVNKHLFFLFPD